MQQELRKCKKPKTSKRFGFTCYEDLNTLIASFAAVKSFLQYIYLQIRFSFSWGYKKHQMDKELCTAVEVGKRNLNLKNEI
jgi:hypothetical protein